MTSFTRTLQTRRKKGHIREKPEFRQRREPAKKQRLNKQLEQEALKEIKEYET